MSPYLNIWSQAGGALWGGLGGVALPEEACPWWLALRAYRLQSPSGSRLLSACSRGREPRAPARYHTCCYNFLP